MTEPDQQRGGLSGARLVGLATWEALIVGAMWLWYAHDPSPDKAAAAVSVTLLVVFMVSLALLGQRLPKRHQLMAAIPLGVGIAMAPQGVATDQPVELVTGCVLMGIGALVIVNGYRRQDAGATARPTSGQTFDPPR